MARYGDPMHPVIAVAELRGEPGNYVLWFSDATVYVGRQGPRVNRLGAHLRRHGDTIIAIQFLRDLHGDACTRAEREVSTVHELAWHHEDRGTSGFMG